MPRPPFRWLIGFAASFLFLATTGCGPDAAERDAALATVRRNVEAMERESVPDVMATVHPESESYEKMETLIRTIASRHHLKYDLKDLHIEKASAKEVRI